MDTRIQAYGTIFNQTTVALRVNIQCSYIFSSNNTSLWDLPLIIRHPSPLKEMKKNVGNNHFLVHTRKGCKYYFHFHQHDNSSQVRMQCV